MIESSSPTPRPSQIMHWVRVGKSNYEVGVTLAIDAITVKNNLQRMFKKLGISGLTPTACKPGYLADGS